MSRMKPVAAERAASRRRRGRPPLEDGDTSVRVSLRLPSRLYDVLYRRAQAARSSVPEQVRRVLQRLDLRHPK